jgi:hypothetical protein
MPDTVIIPSGGSVSVRFASTDTIYLVQAGGSLGVIVGEITGAVAHGSSNNFAKILMTRGTAHDTVMDEYSSLNTSVDSILTNTTLLSHSVLFAQKTTFTGLTIRGGTVDVRTSNVVNLQMDGSEAYFSGTSIDGITLVNGSLQHLTGGSHASNTVISSGSVQDVNTGSYAEWTTINVGCRQ